jgi:hypothetical protein
MEHETTNDFTPAVLEFNEPALRCERQIFLLEAADGSGVAHPILPDQPLALVEGLAEGIIRLAEADGAAVRGIIRPTAWGATLESRGAGCRLDGLPVGDALLQGGDRLAVDGREFVIRRATVNDLLQCLPRAKHRTVEERELALAARERDLAEWEKCLTDLQADLRNREKALQWRTDDAEVHDGK